MPATPNVLNQFSRRAFLQQTGLALAGTALHARAATSEPRASFFVVGDTHFFAEKAEPERMNATSAAYTHQLVDTLNRLPGTEISADAGGGQVPAPNGVLHVGDIIDSGDKTDPVHVMMQRTEWAAYYREFCTRLQHPVMEITGNHDSPHGSGLMIEKLAARQRERKNLKAISPNGLHYSWDWGGVHFAALGLIVGTDRSVDRRRRYAAMDSLAFLQEDLAANTAKDQPLVLMHHVDMARYTVEKPDADFTKWEWDPADVKAFYNVIKDRRVAIFYGHTHFRNVFRWDGSSTKAAKGVAVFNVDNAAHFSGPAQAFFHVEVRGDGLTVREYATTDGWQTGAWTPQVWKVAV